MKGLLIIAMLFIVPKGTETHVQNRDENGKLVSEGWVCENKLKQKNWVFYNDDGTFESCEYVDDVRQGWYKLHRADTAILEIGPYYAGQKQRTWKAYYNDASTLRWEGQFLDDRKTGVWKTYYANGQLQSDGTFADDERVGYWEFYHPNGQLQKDGAYLHGKENDWWVYYDQYGFKTEEGAYERGVKIGVWTRYDEQGNASNVTDYGE